MAKKKVFISGSKSISKLTDEMLAALDKIIQDGDTILVNPGVYNDGFKGRELYNLHGVKALVRSVEGPASTILDGEGKRRVVKGTASETQDIWTNHVLRLEGFTICNGYHNGPGGVAWGIVANCVISNNVATRIGAVSTQSRLENCLIVGNVASNLNSEARGLMLDRTETVNCIIVGNTGNTAGGAAGMERRSCRRGCRG